MLLLQNIITCAFHYSVTFEIVDDKKDTSYRPEFDEDEYESSDEYDEDSYDDEEYDNFVLDMSLRFVFSCF